MRRAVKNSLEIIIKQVRLEGGFERGGKIRVTEFLRQIVPDRLGQHKNFFSLIVGQVRSFTDCKSKYDTH